MSIIKIKEHAHLSSINISKILSSEISDKLCYLNKMCHSLLHFSDDFFRNLAYLV